MLHLAFRGLSLLLFVLTAAGSLPAIGQSCNYYVSGLVEDSDGEVLPGATLYIESLQRGVVAGVDGKFRLNDLCAGNYSLMIKYVGYEDQIVSLKVPSSRPLVIKLKTSPRILHDIVIQGQHAQKHSLSQSASILSADEILSRRGKPLGEIIQQIPGVQSIMTGGSIFKPVIHGLYGQRLLILNNGVRQEGQQWGLEHAPEIDSYLASEIEVVKGSEAVRYGADAMGGAIILNQQPLEFFSSIGGEMNAGFSTNNRAASFSGMLEGGFSRYSGWRVQGTVKKGGDYHAPQYNLSNTGMRELDMSATMGYEKNGKSLEIFASTFNTEIGILRSAHVGNLSDLQQSIVSEKPWYIQDFTYSISNPRQQIGHHLLKVSAATKLGATKSLGVTYGGQYNQRKEYDVRRGNQNAASLSFDLYSHSLDVSLDHEHDLWSGSIGLTGIFKDNYNARGTGLLPDYAQRNFGVFAIEKYRKNKWLFEGGFRYDRQHLRIWIFDQSTLINPSFDMHYFAASAGTSFYISNSARFSSHLALASRPPHVSELFSNGLHHSAASIERGLMIKDDGISTNVTDIRHERSHQWVNAFQYSHGGTSLELSVYANYLVNYVYLSPVGTELTIRGYFPIFEYRQTNAMMAGADAYFSQALSSHFTWLTKFSYVMADDRNAANRIPLIPPPQIDNALTYRKSLPGKWKDFFASLNVQTVFQQARAPRTILPRDVVTEDLTRTFDFMAPPETYFLFRIESGANLALDNRDLTVSFSVDNLFNNSYRNYMNRLRYYADEVGRNFSIRVNYKFHSHEHRYEENK
jgi:iron complex outermembrane recepter protein